MAKYNITEKKEKVAAYRSLVSPKMMDEMQEKIMNIIVMQKKYRDKDYSAKKLAEELGTNTRYISAIVNVRFHMNYTSFVNKYRIEEAMTHGGSQRHGWILQSSVVLCFVLQSRGHHSEGVSPAAPQAASFYAGAQAHAQGKGKAEG